MLPTKQPDRHGSVEAGAKGTLEKMEKIEHVPAESERVIVVQAGSGQAVLWVVAGLLAVIATILIMRWDDRSLGSAAYAQDASRAGGRGIYAFTGQLSKTTFGLFMMDVDSSTLWCYEYVPQRRRLELVAARSWHYDRYLEEYNVNSPTPAEVAQLVERQRSNRASGALPADSP